MIEDGLGLPPETVDLLEEFAPDLFQAWKEREAALAPASPDPLSYTPLEIDGAVCAEARTLLVGAIDVQFDPSADNVRVIADTAERIVSSAPDGAPELATYQAFAEFVRGTADGLDAVESGELDETSAPPESLVEAQEAYESSNPWPATAWIASYCQLDTSPTFDAARGGFPRHPPEPTVIEGFVGQQFQMGGGDFTIRRAEITYVTDRNRFVHNPYLIVSFDGATSDGRTAEEFLVPTSPGLNDRGMVNFSTTGHPDARGVSGADPDTHLFVNPTPSGSFGLVSCLAEGLGFFGERSEEAVERLLE